MVSDFEKSAAWHRFKRSGFGLEDLHVKTKTIWGEHRKFFDEQEPWIAKFKALNNSIADVMKHPGIDPVENERRNNIIFKISELQLENQDEYAKLVSESPKWFDEIYATTNVFEQVAEFIKKNYQNEIICVPKLEQAERELDKANLLYSKIERRLNGAKTLLKEQQNLYYQVVQ